MLAQAIQAGETTAPTDETDETPVVEDAAVEDAVVEAPADDVQVCESSKRCRGSVCARLLLPLAGSTSLVHACPDLLI